MPPAVCQDAGNHCVDGPRRHYRGPTAIGPIAPVEHVAIATIQVASLGHFDHQELTVCTYRRHSGFGQICKCAHVTFRGSSAAYQLTVRLHCRSRSTTHLAKSEFVGRATLSEWVNPSRIEYEATSTRIVLCIVIYYKMLRISVLPSKRHPRFLCFVWGLGNGPRNRIHYLRLLRFRKRYRRVVPLVCSSSDSYLLLWLVWHGLAFQRFAVMRCSA